MCLEIVAESIWIFVWKLMTFMSSTKLIDPNHFQICVPIWQTQRALNEKWGGKKWESRKTRPLCAARNVCSVKKVPFQSKEPQTRDFSQQPTKRRFVICSAFLLRLSSSSSTPTNNKSSRNKYLYLFVRASLWFEQLALRVSFKTNPIFWIFV